MEKEILLEVRNLQVAFNTYLGKVNAIRNVSFSVRKGETVALVGESGCGKSVTAQAIMRLIPTPPGKTEGGEIYFDGKDLLKISQKEMERIRGKEMGIIFQDPMTSLNPTMRIGKQIAEGLRKHQGLGRETAIQKAIEILGWVGITEPDRRIDQYPHEFSGGMRQRVMIAIALGCDPKLLIADEPTTALDVTIQAQILDLMKSIQSRMQTSIILITHDLGIVAAMCDRVLVMYAGKIVESGTVEQIFHSPIHPYTQGLLRSIPRLDKDKTKELIPIYGSPPNLLVPPQGCAFASRCSSLMKICKIQTPELEPLAQKREVACWLTYASGNKDRKGNENE
jgi:oligopeptide transport system ATP-binding protein